MTSGIKIKLPNYKYKEKENIFYKVYCIHKDIICCMAANKSAKFYYGD